MNKKMGRVGPLRAWRPFDFAQDMLGAINFRIGKELSRAKAQRHQGSENPKYILNFAPWRLGARNVLEVILLNILSVRI